MPCQCGQWAQSWSQPYKCDRCRINELWVIVHKLEAGLRTIAAMADTGADLELIRTTATEALQR